LLGTEDLGKRSRLRVIDALKWFRRIFKIVWVSEKVSHMTVHKAWAAGIAFQKALL
jgi:hypothetical protein